MPMPREGNLARGEKGEYAVRRILKAGDAATACEAVETRSGNRVFLKLYTAPTPRCEWFRPYLDYERELNARLAKDDYLRDISVPALDVFAAPLLGSDGTPLSKHPSIFQVFHWVEGGLTLKDVTSPAPGTTPADWITRLYLAKIFVSALDRLHARNIVHTDLKPENVALMLIPMDDGETRQRPTLLDMDFSILSDRVAPWHGKCGYTGTPGYHSPEHLRGEVPQKASDVFTAGIILCELLAGRHPFASAFGGETDELKRRMREGETDFAGHGIPLLRDATESLSLLLEQSLSPDPNDRPTAAQLAGELSLLRRRHPLKGRLSLPPDAGTPADLRRETERAARAVEGETAMTATPTKPTTMVAPDTARPEVAPYRAGIPAVGSSKLILLGKTGAIRTRVPLAPTRTLFERAVGDDARFTDRRPQFEVMPEAGVWIVRPTKAANATFLNGEPLVEPAVLKSGDVLSIQNLYAKLTVSFAA